LLLFVIICYYLLLFVIICYYLLLRAIYFLFGLYSVILYTFLIAYLSAAVRTPFESFVAFATNQDLCLVSVAAGQGGTPAAVFCGAAYRTPFSFFVVVVVITRIFRRFILVVFIIFIIYDSLPVNKPPRSVQTFHKCIF